MVPRQDKCPVFFFDRDGTVIIDLGYPSDPNQIELLPHSVESLKEIKKIGFKLALISNQSGVGRGFFTEETMWKVHSRLKVLLHRAGVSLDAVRYCTAAPWEKNPNRKPEPGMILSVAKELNADLAASFMIGDKVSDVQAGLAAGCRAILFGSSENPHELENVPRCTSWAEIPRMVQSSI